jgi:hypothetical protein
MAYGSVTDRKFLSTLEDWFRNRTEILVLFRFSYAAGRREFEFFSSLQSFCERIGQLPPLTNVIAFRQPQLPIRGVVDDRFIDQCLNRIPEGSEYLIVEMVRRVAGRSTWFHHGAGASHAELRDDLEESRGAQVAVGIHPPWLRDTEEVISAVVPDEHGVAKSGIY